MYIVVSLWYPTDKVEEVTNRYFEMLKELPFDRSLGKETIPVAVTTNKKGIHSMSIMNAKEGKLQEALTWTGKRLIKFQNIQGCEYKVRTWSTVTEALESIGKSLPE